MVDQPDNSEDELLSELDSLQSMLQGEDTAASIPVLDKILDDKGSQVIPTLEDVMLNSQQSGVGENFDLENLIQEVVNEFLPVLEIELRKRLQEIPPHTLQQWLEELSKR